jgi:hypothetical protein
MKTAILVAILDYTSPIYILGARVITRSIRIAIALTKEVTSVPIRKISLITTLIINIVIIVSYIS